MGRVHRIEAQEEREKMKPFITIRVYAGQDDETTHVSVTANALRIPGKDEVSRGGKRGRPGYLLTCCNTAYVDPAKTYNVLEGIAKTIKYFEQFGGIDHIKHVPTTPTKKGKK
jgi:hypothetical protein